MVDKWREVKLGEIAEIYDGPHATPKKTESGPIFLGISNLSRGLLDLSNTEHISENDFHRWTRRVEPEEGDVVFSYETRLGEAARISHGLRCCLGRRMGLLRARVDLVDPRFLLYAYLGPDFQDTLYSLTVHGSTVDRIPLINMPHFPIVIPGNIQEQRRIAHILGTLDDKIENNRKTAKTLEAMAQAIFKSWFVDFDPVRAKMAGESRESICKRLKLTPEILDLFPDRLVDSELGEIPEGWSYSRLGDVADVNWGNTRVTKKFYVNQGYLAYSATGPDGFLPYYEHDHVGGVVSAIGVNSGYTWLALGKWSTIKNTIRFWSDSADMNTEYLYLATHNINFWPLRGSAQPFISQTDARNTKILHPSKNLAKVFGESASKLFQVVHQKERKSQYLIHLRDTLLPKLISGEIRVSDAQAVVDTTANASKLFHD